MKLKLSLLGAAAFAALLACAPAPAYAGGWWSDWVGIGLPSYCASIVTGTGNLSGTTGTGQGTIGSICAQTVPAGPTTFAGTEYLPLDIYALGANVQSGGPSSAVVTIVQLGQGPMVDQTTVGTTQTIPANTPWFFLDGSQGSALTVTMPANAVEGQIQHVVCEAATVGTLTVAANTSVVTQVLKGNPNTACVAGVGYAWRYQASNLTWYRYQ